MELAGFKLSIFIILARHAGLKVINGIFRLLNILIPLYLKL
jgi:hypothetical protein